MITILCARKTFLLLLLQQKATEIQRAKACLTTEERRTHFENFFLQILGLETLTFFFSLLGKNADTCSSHFQHHDANIVALFVLFEDHAEQPSARQHE